VAHFGPRRGTKPAEESASRTQISPDEAGFVARPARPSYGGDGEQEVQTVGGQRRKKGGRVTPRGGSPVGRLTGNERAGLVEIFDRMLRSAPKDLTDDLPPLVVEMWGSQMWSIWAKSELVGMDAVDVFAGGLIEHAAKRASEAALMVLRALGAVAPEPYGTRARREADRLAVAGVPERRWAEAMGTDNPTVAWLSYDPIDDDGVNVMVGFDGPHGPTAVGVYVDHNLGGMAKDAFAVPAAMDEVLAKLRHGHDDLDEPRYREISLEEAGLRWRQAFEVTDMYLDPPCSEDLEHLRALVMARLAELPTGGEVPAPEGLSEEARDRLVQDFLESDETIGLWPVDDEHDDRDTVEQLADNVLTFSLDYVVGTPLRFSPVMVEFFCLDWAPRKIAMDGDAFTLLPDVLAAWIRFVGRRRVISEVSIKQAVDAAYEYAPEMIELSQEPEVWGPAKTMALAVRQRGIDLTDQRSLDEFVAEVNRKGGIDVLAESLAESVLPRH
jgi:hypothetical protein